jgi:hypothetical protein
VAARGGRLPKETQAMAMVAATMLFVLMLTLRERGDEPAREDDRVRTPTLSLTLRPAACQTGCAARARVTVEPHADNRWLTLLFESGEFRRSSGVSLDGEQADRFHSLAVEGLPAGDYVVQARLRRSTGEVLVKERALVVKGRRH